MSKKIQTSRPKKQPNLAKAFAFFNSNLYDEITKENLDPTKSCILSSLIAKDYFSKIGFKADLVEVVVSVEFFNENDDLKRLFHLGNPSDAKIDHYSWPGHLVVRIDDENIIDSTLGQLSSLDEKLFFPDIFRFKIQNDVSENLLIDTKNDVIKVVDFEFKPISAFKEESSNTHMSYFQVNSSFGYIGSPDSSDSRRSNIVKNLIEGFLSA